MDPVLVLGGNGALGHHLIQHLLSTSPSLSVTSFDINTTTNRIPGAHYLTGSITSPSALRSALASIRPTVIFHTVSPSLMGQSHTHALYHSVNVTATENLLSLIAETPSVKALVYTSSLSVIHDNMTDLVDATEEGRLFYWPETTEYYSHTKALAEDLVQAANGKNGLLTMRLRGALLFGEGDTSATPNMIANARAGRSRYQIGDGTNLFDFTYIGNFAYAHILAAEALLREHDGRADRNGPLKVNGEAICVTNDAHWPFWDFTRAVAAEAGHPVPKDQVTVVPRWAYYIVSVIAEWAVWAMSFGAQESTLNRRMVKYLTMNRTFNISKAKERLGYRPQVSVEEGIKRAVQYYLANEPNKKSN